MIVYDVMIEYPNGAVEVRKTEVSLEAAKKIIIELEQKLLKTTEGDKYRVYYTPTENTLRKEMKVVKSDPESYE